MDIKIQNISKRYAGNVDYTLENIDLDIKSGEFVVLLGPSGCGKTTLLRMIAGLNSITKGDLLFGNRKVNNVEPKDRDLAFVFQSYALYPHLSVYKNISYSLKIRKVKKEQIDARVKSVAKLLQIDHLLFNKPSEISGGQRQRVALGRAIARKPSIFLMDEPLSNLDAKLRESMRTELVKIHNMVGATTVYVTHDQLEAMTMADKIVLFNDRKIQQVGSPLDLYNRPANLFTANFIGAPSMNFIETKRVSGGWEMLEGSKMTIGLKTKVPSQFDDVTIGVRTEHIELSMTKPTTGAIIEGKVLNSELLGKETVVVTEYALNKYIRISIPSQEIFKPGDIVYVKFNEEHVHLFDTKTGDRIELDN